LIVSLALAIALLADGAAHAGQQGAIEAVSTCLAAVGVGTTDDARLAADGWTERPVENIDKAPGGAAANRLFTREGAGAAIMINVSVREKRTTHHCHVITQRSAAEAAALDTALGKHLGGKVTPLGPAMTFFEVPGYNFIVTSNRKPSGDKVMIDIHTMAFELKETKK
jgi:hypothetical protein